MCIQYVIIHQLNCPFYEIKVHCCKFIFSIFFSVFFFSYCNLHCLYYIQTLCTLLNIHVDPELPQDLIVAAKDRSITLSWTSTDHESDIFCDRYEFHLQSMESSYNVTHEVPSNKSPFVFNNLSE